MGVAEPVCFFQAEDGIRDWSVTGVQTCALPIYLDVNGGSFSTGSANAALFYSRAGNRFSVSADGFHTNRYLDPPVLENYTNLGNAGGFSASYEHDFSNGDRVFSTFTQHAVRYLVPNELA